MESKNYWVYKITSKSKRVYIGITSNIVKRFNAYKNLNCKHQIILYNSLKKYGFERHKIEIVFCFLTKNDAIAKEIELIKVFKELNKSLNITDGGESPKVIIGKDNHRSKKVIQFSSDGKIIQYFDNIDLASKSSGVSASFLAKVCRTKSFHAKGYLWCFQSDYDLGIYPIEGFNCKIKKHTKPVQQFNKKGELLGTFKSIQEASKITGIHSGIIYSALLYNRNSRKFTWKAV